MARYTLTAPPPEAVAEELKAYPPLFRQLLFSRGVTTSTAAAAFLAPDYEAHLRDPFLLNDMTTAVTSILEAIAAKQKITIYSDYDCDGIPGGVVLHDFFTAIGYDNFENYIPHRHYDGFGLHLEAVEKLAEAGTNLIITVDCGTTDVEAVAYAKAKGITTIITDHHQPATTLPEAVAIVNPQLGDYPNQGLCGAAVAYKLAQALLQKGDFAVTAGREKWWLDLVGLATIADLVPLTGENRVLAHFGLAVLRKTRRPGLLELFRRQRVNPSSLTEDDIGFTIAPRINAASRMDTPEEAFRMLATTDSEEATTVVAHLEKLNQERKSTVAVMTRQAHNHLKALLEIPLVIVLGDPNWRPSLVGLVAGKLADENKRPTFVWGRDGNGVIKGSARSGGGLSVHSLMSLTSDHFIEFGGHQAAGGFSVAADKIHTLSQALNDSTIIYDSEMASQNHFCVDYVTTLDQLTMDDVRQQRALAPFGVGNAKPVILVQDATPVAVESFGKSREHTKLTFQTKGVAREAIAFFRSPEQFTVVPQVGQPTQLIAHLEESTFNGRVSIRLRILEIMAE